MTNSPVRNWHLRHWTRIPIDSSGLRCCLSRSPSQHHSLSCANAADHCTHSVAGYTVKSVTCGLASRRSHSVSFLFGKGGKRQHTRARSNLSGQRYRTNTSVLAFDREKRVSFYLPNTDNRGSLKNTKITNHASQLLVAQFTNLKSWKHSSLISSHEKKKGL